jgi:hypothetical protein
VDECKPLEFGDRNSAPTCGDASTGSFTLLGRAVQVDPMKPKLKPPGTERLKLKCVILLSTSAFKFDLRRYSSGAATATWCSAILPSAWRQGLTHVHFSAQLERCLWERGCA